MLANFQKALMDMFTRISNTNGQRITEVYNLLVKVNRKLDAMRLLTEMSLYTPEFEQMLKATLGIEGLMSNDKSDLGGLTFMGISSQAYPHLKDEIAAGSLSYDEVTEIYYRDYYSVIYRVEELDPKIRYIIFDAKVHGTYESIITMQRWLNNNKSCNLVSDGIYGKLTFNCLSQLKNSDIQILISYLKFNMVSDAQHAAQRVIKAQHLTNAGKYDYTNGFRNRLAHRYDNALLIG